MSAEPPRRSAQTGQDRSFVFARVAGVPVAVSPSWLLAGVLLCAVYGPILRDAVDGLGTGAAYGAALGFAVLFGLCVLAHEAGHTLVSIRLGHPVRRIVLFALGGVSEMEHEPSRARDELLIAASGPLVSALLATGAGFAYDAAPAGQLLTALLGLLFWSNAGLAAFNLLPGLPLDGGRLVRAAVTGLGARPFTATRVAAASGRLIAVALLVFGFVADRSAAGLAGGLFTALVAGYLWFAAGQSVAEARIADRLPAISVPALLRPGLLVPGDLSVAAALERVWQAGVRGLVVVDGADRPVAIVDEARISAVPPEQRPWTPVFAVARPLAAGLTVPADLSAEDLLDRIRAAPASEYLAVHGDGRPAGIISTRDLVDRLRGQQ
ncbi:MAG TPA: site-2 protease family protein [Jatrophihabitans sp.]|nr:site-2 protease family protein [Jatrophihabitans sp.]